MLFYSEINSFHPPGYAWHNTTKMDIEKFVKSPYRALVMVIITCVLVLLGIPYMMHIIGNFPEKRELLTMNNVWLIPALISAYAWCAVTVIAFVMILLDRPLKSYKDESLIGGLIFGVTLSFIFGLALSFIFGFAFFIISLAVGFAMGLIRGIIGEFSKPDEKSEDTTDTPATDAS